MRCLTESPAQYKVVFQRFVEVITLFSLPMAVIVICTVGDMVALLLGPKWLDAGPIPAILGILTICRGDVRESSMALYLAETRRTSAAASLLGLAAAGLVKEAFPADAPIRGIVQGAGVALLTIAAVLLMLPSGRATLGHVKEAIVQLRSIGSDA